LRKAASLSTLKNKLDKLWSEYVRRKDAIDGIATCVTCGTQKHWKEMQCGHFVSRTHLATRWLVNNTAVQCARCNILLRGNMVEYAVWMEANWGWQAIRDLRELKHRSVKYSRTDYEEMINDVQQKLGELG